MLKALNAVNIGHFNIWLGQEVCESLLDSTTTTWGGPAFLRKKTHEEKKKDKEEKKIGLSKLLTGVLAPRQHGASG
jgi:hypothetical protein